MTMRTRAFAAAAFILVSGLLLRATTTGFVSKYGGVALWATLVHLLIVAAFPEASRTRAFLGCVAVSWAVEFFQMTSIPRKLAELHRGFALVFGTTFSAADLPAYVVGAAFGVVIHTLIRRR